jgi:NodT family efflux transporter outer membrane factor (OMF) lipoprotein
VREARAQTRVAQAAELPSINASGNALTYNSDRKRAAAAAASGAAAPSGLAGLPIPTHTDLYSVGFDATWEVDLFGGTRRSIEASRASAEAAEWARRDGQVSLLAEMANDYFTLRAVQARIALGQAELKREQDLFTLIQARRQTGFVTDLDVEQQATQVETAAAQIPQLQAQASAEVHAIAILLAEAPETVEQGLTAEAAPLPAPPAGLPVGLPSDLLRRRPDIREAERRLAAANAQIGVQEARRYPQFNLIGLGSFAGTAVDSLFSQQNLASVALGMVTQPVFDGGRSHGQIAAAREERLQADVAYRKAVLGAFRDVEDALARYRSEQDRRGNLARSVISAQNSLNIAKAQYRTGFVTYINVLQADNSLLNAKDQLTQSNAQLLSDLIALYKALGGGWTASS